MSERPTSGVSAPVSAALCISEDALDRWGRVLRHLVVGLVDQAVPLRLLSSDPRVAALKLGPVQAVSHPPMDWPLASRRVARLADALSGQPPTVFHAISGESYLTASQLAERLDADFVAHVSSWEECDRLGDTGVRPPSRVLASGEALAAALEKRQIANSATVRVCRPGALASEKAACFQTPGRVATMLCTSPFERDSGVEDLIEAAALLRPRGHDFLLFLLGRGSREDVFRKIVRARRLSSVVTFARPAGDVEATMTSADLYVRPAAEAALPFDSLHAMGAGLAVVACPNPICEHFRDGETATLAAGSAPDHLAAAIESLIADRDKARRLANGGLEHIRRQHTVSGMAECVATTYRELALSHATFTIRE